MTNIDLLDAKIKQSGLKLGKIAEALDMSYLTFQRKRTNEAVFNATEIEKLCNLLDIESPAERCAIFFSQNVD